MLDMTDIFSKAFSFDQSVGPWHVAQAHRSAKGLGLIGFKGFGVSGLGITV